MSPYSWMWKPCLPGGSPLTSATTFMPASLWVNLTVPETEFPAVALITAMAEVTGESARARPASARPAAAATRREAKAR